MLLRFGLTNHASFRDPTELSFIATSQADEPSWRMATREAPFGVLPVLGVWGANAAGKSNLLRALIEFRTLVKYSFTSMVPDAPLPWSPFAMRTGETAAPTQMDVDLVIAGQRYHYGIRFTAQGILEEWLFAWPKHRRQVLFHRDHSQKDPWYFGAGLGGQRQVIARATRQNSLFLSAAAQHNHERLSPLYRAITDAIVLERQIKLHGYPLFREDSPIMDPVLKPIVTAFLRAADVGVMDLRAEQVAHKNAGPEELAKILQPDFAKEVLEVIARSKALYKLHLKHGASDEHGWELPPELESRGTHILLRRLEDLLLVLRSGGVLVLDEIDTSLHPDLCGALIDLFTGQPTNPKGAQLVFSTHHEALLRRLRRDEVVLVDKSEEGVSTIRTASEYADVRGRDDLTRAYAQGRVGGVPALGDLTRLMAQEFHHVP